MIADALSNNDVMRKLRLIVQSKEQFHASVERVGVGAAWLLDLFKVLDYDIIENSLYQFKGG